MINATDIITLLWPPNAHPAVVRGKWQRVEWGIVADYTREELLCAVACTCSPERWRQLKEEINGRK